MTKTILSLGAGVQSSTMALMAAHGEITPMPEAAIFADTGAEPQRVYDYLDWLEGQLPFPVHRVMWKGGLLQNIHESLRGGRFAGAPFYTEPATIDVEEPCDCQEDEHGEYSLPPSPDCDYCGGNGLRPVLMKREGQLRRECTREFKIQPITRKVRELVGLAPGQRAPKGVILAEQWVGISTDEIIRMKDAREKWLQNRWPLIELKMTRWHCLEWIRAHGYPEPGKSSCTFCPYHDNEHWLDMKENDPPSFTQAVDVDELVRGGVRGTKQKLYLHRSLVPLKDADLTTPESAGQLSFLDECDGMCGV